MAEGGSEVGLLKEDSEQYSGDFTKISSEEQQALRFPIKLCRLVLVGKTGNGKSDTANHLYGQQHFKVGEDLCSTSTKCYWGQVTRFGVSMEIVDTPGVFDTETDDAVINKELVRCLGQVAPGPHAVLFVVRTDSKFTKEEAKVKEYLCSLFGDGLLNHMIVVFTHGDFMRGKDMKEFLGRCPRDLKELLKLINYRYVTFDNTLDLGSTDNDCQVRNLLEVVKDLLIRTDNSHFTNRFLARCQEIMVASTRDIAMMLEQDPNSPKVRELVMLSLHAKDNIAEILDQALEAQAQVKQQGEQRHDELMTVLQAIMRKQTKTEEEMEQIKNNLKTTEAEAESLRAVVKREQESTQELENELENEKKKWKCAIM